MRVGREMFCSPGKAAGLFDLGWTLLPGIVAKLAWWRLHTWPEVDIHKALLFVAATKEAGDASVQVVAALCDLETWLPRPDAAGQPLFGLTPMTGRPRCLPPAGQAASTCSPPRSSTDGRSSMT